jgi:hypothetical protein
MAVVITPDTYAARTGQTFAGAALAAVTETCAAVNDAITRYLKPYSPVPVTVTNYPLDAPPGNVLTLPVLPVRGITSLYLHWYANGDPSVFTSTDLLTAFTDYYLPVDPVDGYSRTGEVYRRNSSSWAFEYRYATQRSLYPTIDPNRGAILFSGTCGELSVPDAVVQAGVLMTSLLYARRRTGMVVGSASLNGASYSNALPYTATSALDTPDVRRLLQQYKSDICYVAGS